MNIKLITLLGFFFMNCNTEVPLIPLKVLFGNPVRSSVCLSPSGTYVSYCAPYNGVMNIFIRRKDGMRNFTEERVLTRFGLQKDAVRSYFWSYDEKKIFFSRDNDGDENTQIFSIDVQTGIVTPITPLGVKASLVDYDEKYSNRMYIAMNKRDPSVFDLHVLNLETNEISLCEECPANGLGWVLDNTQKVRFLFAVTEDGGKQLLIKEDGTWKPWLVWTREDEKTSGPLFFSADNAYLYCQDSRGRNTSALVKISCISKEITPIAHDDEVDFGQCVFNKRTLELEEVSWIKDRMVQRFFNEEYRRKYEYIASRDTGECYVNSRTLDDRYWIVAFVKDNGPVTYYYYDTQEKVVVNLGDNQPELRNYRLTEVESIKYQSRDGITIHGYISYPTEGSRKNMPLVLYVHGGPWVRDTWGYNPTVQFFTNRGYACMQVNYRGSTGYGKKFIDIANKQWSKAMHDDLVDAVQWAIDAGIADKKKVAIYGGSYGGYAALVGATHTPDLFCCAVDIVGPSSLITLIRSIPPYWKVFLEDFYLRVGNPDTEEDFLKSCSPLFHVDKIKIPLLIAQGANDPRVKQAEAEQIVDALKKKNIPHTYLLFPDEGHGFAKPENRLKFMETVDTFLSQNLGNRRN